MKKVLLFLLTLLMPLNVFALTTNAKSAIIMDMDSRRIFYQHNSEEKRLIASTTKIMTSVIAIEQGNMKDIVTVGEEVLTMYGSNIYLELNEQMSLEDLLYGLLLRSGNDAAIVIATYIGKTEENFVNMMNAKAKELGMNNTMFSNSHGLDEKTQNYSTALDMAILSRYANTLDKYKEITSTKKKIVATGKKTYIWQNRNKLLTLYEYATGGKTGYTPKAGRTLVTTASNNNLNLTAVTLNDSDEYIDHKKMYGYVFNNYEKYLIIDKNTFGVGEKYQGHSYYIDKSFSYPLTKEEAENIKVIVGLYNLDDYSNNSIIGEVKVFLNEKKIYQDNIYVSIIKEKKPWYQKLWNFFKSLFK